MKKINSDLYVSDDGYTVGVRTDDGNLVYYIGVSSLKVLQGFRQVPISELPEVSNRVRKLEHDIALIGGSDEED